MSHATPPDPQWAPPPNSPWPPAGPPKKKRRWPWVVIAVGLLMLVVGVATSGNDPQATQNRPGTPSGVTDYVPPTFAAPAPPPAAVPAPAPAPSGPLTEFSDGTYEVGTGAGQIAPGRYKSPGSGMCYWARLKNGDGAIGDIIDNNAGAGQQLLTVRDSDGLIEVAGGCTFTKAG